MRKNNEVFPSYTLFNSFPNKNVSPFNKFMMIIFFIYILITFSDEGLINALSEQIISDYNISPEKLEGYYNYTYNYLLNLMYLQYLDQCIILLNKSLYHYINLIIYLL